MKTEMKFYRLEYNPKDNNRFHLDNYTHQSNTSGWTTIDDKAEDRLASRFIAYFKQYHMDKAYITSDVISMWKLFSGTNT
jgi:hypothetical protein